MTERLQKVLAHAGVSSRRAAERLIIEGRVTVNGAIVAELGTKVDPDRDAIKVDGKRVAAPPSGHTYLAMNKPRGVVTTLADPEGRPTG
jgi:23S rRNA pseudouridine2605 synthase